MSSPGDRASAHPALWIAVEGPDGAGKSSIAKQLAHILASDGGSAPRRPCVLQKLSYDSPPEHYLERPLNMKKAWWPEDAHVVQDRSALSTLVYEPVIRKDWDRLDRFKNIVLTQTLTGVALVHVTASLPVLEERVESRGDDYVRGEQLKEIVEGYERETAHWRDDLDGRIAIIDTTWGFPSATELLLELSILAAGR